MIEKFIFNGRISEKIEIAANGNIGIKSRINECRKIENEVGLESSLCGKFKIGVYLWGDSHANAVLSSLTEAADLYNVSVEKWTYPGCPPLFNADLTDWRSDLLDKHKCLRFSEWIKNSSNRINNIPIVLVSRTSLYLYGKLPEEAKRDGEIVAPYVYFKEQYKNSTNQKLQHEFQQAIIDTACELKKTNPVFLVRPFPEMNVDVPKTLSRNLLLNRNKDDIKITLTEYYKRNKLVFEAQDIAVKQCGVKILNPLQYLCNNEFCYGSINGRPLYSDDDHLNDYGNKLIEPMFEQIFNGREIKNAND
jgi:hypothetical protein